MDVIKNELVKLFNLSGDINDKAAILLTKLGNELDNHGAKQALAELLSALLSAALEIGARSQLDERTISRQVAELLKASSDVGEVVFSHFKGTLSETAFQQAMKYLRFWKGCGVDLPDSIEESAEPDKLLRINWFVTYVNERRNANVCVDVCRDGRIMIRNNIMYPRAGFCRLAYQDDSQLFSLEYLTSLGLAATSWQCAKFNPLRHLGH